MSARLTWGDIVEELRPYPGRGWMTLRIVLGVLLATVLVMAFRIENGWLSLYFSFVFAKSTTRATLLDCAGILFVSVPVVLLSLLLLKYAADPTWLRLLVLTAVIYGAFFLANIMRNGDVPRNLTIIFATVLTLPDVFPYPHLWVQGTFKLISVVFIGVVPIVLTTFLIRPERNWDAAHRPPPETGGFVPGWRTDPAHHIYALKCTFAAMSTYFIYTLLNFQEIQTAMMTCLILALPTTEQIIHKTWLRIVGALIGSAIALFSAVWIIPQSNALGLLLAAIGAGATVAAWVALSSKRISYAGWQIGLVQFMLITHSFGPSGDLSILKDRIIGILLGNVMMGITFKYLWPEKPQRSPRLPQLGRIVPLICVGLFALALCGCQNTEDLAPQNPREPWRGPQATEYRLPPVYAAPAAPQAAPEGGYTLSELADLALRNNPKTRIAWEQARAAAAEVGAVRSAYYPQLNLLVAAGYERIPAPLPRSLFPQGYFYSDAAVIRPELQLDWVLWDFGRRDATERVAREQTMAQNFAFNAVHQTVLFNVCRAYYKLVTQRAQLDTLTAAHADAVLIEQAVQAAKDQGFATQTELLQARQQVAQLTFDVTAQRAELRKGQADLAETVGVDPRAPLPVRDVSDTPLPEHLELSVDALIDRALADRPDLRAHVAALRAAEAGVDLSKAQSGPTVVLSGNLGPIYSAFNADDTGWVSEFKPQYGVSLGVTWAILDGNRSRYQTLAAQAQQRQMQAMLSDARNSAVREVWAAFTDYENARGNLRAAEALVSASEASWASTMASFKQGFSNVTDVQTQQTLLTKARESYRQSRIALFLSVSLLQFATGQLSAESMGTPQ